MRRWCLAQSREILLGLVCFLLASPLALGQGEAGDEEHAESTSRFSDVAIGLQIDDVPPRPQPLLEIGTPFLHPGEIGEGIVIPTGAVWQPNFLVYGTLRSAVLGLDRGDGSLEWANRLDLFGNLQLTGSERVLIGLRPLDEEGAFSGRRFSPLDESVDAVNTEVETLFFEGDFGELFPGLDPDDFGQKDVGFSVGRQPITFQDGHLIDDNLDAIAITKNSFNFGDIPNVRLTGLFAWDDIHRGDRMEDESASLYGLLCEADLVGSTVEIDILRARSDVAGSDAFFAGIGATQRIGHANTTFRVMTSQPEEDTAAVTRGTLLFSEVSWTPHHSEDVIYTNAFLGLDRFSSAARRPSSGGPLGQTGILFAAPGLGSVDAPLGSDPADSAGLAVGWQQISPGGRDQHTLEIGARSDTDGSDAAAAAVGSRYQRAIGQHTVFVFDLYGGVEEDEGGFSGARFELLFKF
jgi:hypothetical protein